MRKFNVLTDTGGPIPDDREHTLELHESLGHTVALRPIPGVTRSAVAPRTLSMEDETTSLPEEVENLLEGVSLPRPQAGLPPLLGNRPRPRLAGVRRLTADLAKIAAG